MRLRSLFIVLALFPFFVLTAKDITDNQTHFLNRSTLTQKLASSVNPITGELQLEAVDLIVAGIEPLSVRRFYSHTSNYDPRYATWRYNPETYLAANFDWDKMECFAAIGSFDGGLSCLQNKDTNIFTFNPAKHKAATFMPSGQTHPLNTKVKSWRHHESKERFAWMAEVIDGSGTVRNYATSIAGTISSCRSKKRKVTSCSTATFLPSGRPIRSISPKSESPTATL